MKKRIKRALVEGMTTPENLAMCVGEDSIVLYDHRALSQIDTSTFNDAFYDAIVGVIIVTDSPLTDDEGTLVKFVEYVATSRNGVGPFLYDCAMKFFGPITHNNGPISPDAWRVWNFYAKKRPDLHVQVIDPEEAEELFDELSLEDLDRTHVIVSGAKPDTGVLEAAHDDLVSRAVGSGFNSTLLNNKIFRVSNDWVDDHV